MTTIKTPLIERENTGSRWIEKIYRFANSLGARAAKPLSAQGWTLRVTRYTGPGIDDFVDMYNTPICETSIHGLSAEDVESALERIEALDASHLPAPQPRPGLYLCSRASNWDGQPCAEAYKIKMFDGEDLWAAEVPDILAFIDKHGKIIIELHKSGIYHITIYDSYVE